MSESIHDMLARSPRHQASAAVGGHPIRAGGAVSPNPRTADEEMRGFTLTGRLRSRVYLIGEFDDGIDQAVTVEQCPVIVVSSGDLNQVLHRWR